jgi:protein TonB
VSNESTEYLTPYGAFELKRCYQRNFALAVGIVTALYLVGILIFIFVTHRPGKEAPVAVRTIVIDDIASLAPPPTLQRLPPRVAYAAPQVQAPTVGIPQAVPDEEAPENVTMATQQELKVISAPPVEDLGEEGGAEQIIIADLDELLPKPDEFVPVEEMPVAVKKVEPQYPELARRAGIEGSVWVKALVDKSGKVRNVIIMKESGANAGFEEAAIKAAYGYVYKPAISNGQPVAVWVAYKVNFKIR